MSLERLAARAVKAAGHARQRCGVPVDAPVCPFDAAERLEVSVRLVPLPTLEGMYVKETATILVGSERPAGRRRYSCAHELGHHTFEHGTRIHRQSVTLRGVQRSHNVNWTEEFLANRFAGALLMSKVVVLSAFARRGWSATQPTPSQVFRVAQELGVGYLTLVAHMLATLQVLDATTARALQKVQLKTIRRQLSGQTFEGDVVALDAFWRRPCVDVEVGDLLISDVEMESAGNALGRGLMRTQVVAIASGGAEVQLRGVAKPFVVRVSRRQFSGLARYRHLEGDE
jgi:Zn-dependent peptidase ImmA (M78 family)